MELTSFYCGDALALMYYVPTRWGRGGLLFHDMVNGSELRFSDDVGYRFSKRLRYV